MGVPYKKKKACKKKIMKKRGIDFKELNGWQALAIQNLMPHFKYFERPQSFSKTITIDLDISFEIGWEDGDDAWSSDAYEAYDDYDLIDQIRDGISDEQNIYQEKVDKMVDMVEEFASQNNIDPSYVFEFLSKNVKFYTAQDQDPSISPGSVRPIW